MLAATQACADEPQKRPWKDPGTVLLEAAGGCGGQTLPSSGAAEPAMLAMRMGRSVPALSGMCPCPSAWQLIANCLKTTQS